MNLVMIRNEWSSRVVDDPAFFTILYFFSVSLCLCG
jgi:hypothetical protein